MCVSGSMEREHDYKLSVGGRVIAGPGERLLLGETLAWCC